MEIFLRGRIEDIEKFLEEILYPAAANRDHFRITENNGEYRQSIKKCYKVRKVRGYFPETYRAAKAGDQAAASAGSDTQEAEN